MTLGGLGAACLWGHHLAAGDDAAGMSGCCEAQGWRAVEGGSWAGHAHRAGRGTWSTNPQELIHWKVARK